MRIDLVGHHLHALVAPLPVSLEVARDFDLTVLERGGFAVVPLHPAHSDAWTEQLNPEPRTVASSLLLDLPVTHALAAGLVLERYALLETDYFGGAGTQPAALYEGGALTLEGSVNAVLAGLGVVRAGALDEFDTLELGPLRDTDAFFAQYLEPERSS